MLHVKVELRIIIHFFPNPHYALRIMHYECEIRRVLHVSHLQVQITFRRRARILHILIRLLEYII